MQMFLILQKRYSNNLGYNLYKNDESLEGINRIQNIEELLNGIKDFVENNEKSQASVSSFLQKP